MPIILSLFLLPSCASSTLYDGAGHRLAHFEGDMNGVNYSRAADGSVQMSGTIYHSPATIAQGKAIAGGTVAATGLVTLLAP